MGQGAYAPGRQQMGAVIFLPHEIYKNSVSSVEAEIGTERQIMCIEQWTFLMSSVVFLDPQNAAKSLAAGASPQTLLGELTALPNPARELGLRDLL